jgi:hypothetical protein
MTSGDPGQLIAALWSVGEQIRDPQYRNDMQGLRNVAHRNHLEKGAGGPLSVRGTVTSPSDCHRHTLLFHQVLFASPQRPNKI